MRKKLRSMKLCTNERSASDGVSPAHNGQEQITAGNLGIVKRLKYKNEGHDEIGILNKRNLDDVKPGRGIELLHPDQMNLANINDELVSVVKSDLCTKPLALVADYGGDSSSDSTD
ncbi:hypothetical protein LOAG_17227 [Loa loa]|nr:hypothetical protein LOAG_17227 [Loa loa]EJD75702.1 hypothetical protein LOAG_17227 [Loa loa]